MEDVGALAPDFAYEGSEVAEEIALTQWAIVSWHFARRTAAIIRDSTNTTKVFAILCVRITTFLANIPIPLGNGMPMLDYHLHCSLPMLVVCCNARVVYFFHPHCHWFKFRIMSAL